MSGGLHSKKIRSIKAWVNMWLINSIVNSYWNWARIWGCWDIFRWTVFYKVCSLPSTQGRGWRVSGTFAPFTQFSLFFPLFCSLTYIPLSQPVTSLFILIFLPLPHTCTCGIQPARQVSFFSLIPWSCNWSPDHHVLATWHCSYWSNCSQPIGTFVGFHVCPLLETKHGVLTWLWALSGSPTTPLPTPSHSPGLVLWLAKSRWVGLLSQWHSWWLFEFLLLHCLQPWRLYIS